MAFWLASSRSGQDRDWIQRFDPRFWTVNFPRPMMAAATVPAADSVRVDVRFLTRGDLAGLIWESEDRVDHPLTAYRTDCDYGHTTLSFRFRSGGIIPLDAVNGPTLTIEGRDADGSARTWYVRLWNYARSGTPTDARIEIPFQELLGGFLLPAEADPVHPSAIDRMFISLVPPTYVPGSTSALATPAEGWAELSEIRCDGERATLEIGDVLVPPHGVGCATAFDDSCNLTPARVIRNLLSLGYRGSLVHYVGMSHFMNLRPEAAGYLVDPAAPAFCTPAQTWHQSFLDTAAPFGFSPILSFSYECLAQHCPDAWQQRAFDGSPARTGWVPPSALLSPASSAAMAWLDKVARALANLQKGAGLPVRVQIGEPWWWVDSAGRIYLYDSAARTALGGSPPEIVSLNGTLSAAQIALLDSAGGLLAGSTLALRDAIRAEAAPAAGEVRLLAFTPTVLDPTTPDAQRANLPTGWHSPAFDRLQLEDYDWLTAGADGMRTAAYTAVEARLGYGAAAQDYFSGFVLLPEHNAAWRKIDAGIDEARARGVPNVFIWALPQICRDGFVRLPHSSEDDLMQAFDDVAYPLALGLGTSVTPEFSTNITVTASGFERRNSVWSDARLRFDVGPGVRSEADLGTLLTFFRARRGAARGFRLRDPSDYSSNAMTGTPTALDQKIGAGDGLKTAFPLIKRYGDGDEPQVRRITRPVAASVKVSIDGTIATSGWSLGPLGTVSFATPPVAGAIIRAGYLFDVPARFAEDHLQVSGASFAAGEAPAVPVLEIREDV